MKFSAARYPVTGIPEPKLTRNCVTSFVKQHDLKCLVYSKMTTSDSYLTHKSESTLGNYSSLCVGTVTFTTNDKANIDHS